jgi:hypothetical protein
MVDAAQLQLKLYMRDGRIVRSLAEALALVREHESRPGVDVRDEVLHLLERARTDHERQAAAAAFIAWAEELNLLLPSARSRPAVALPSLQRLKPPVAASTKKGPDHPGG